MKIIETIVVSLGVAVALAGISASAGQHGEDTGEIWSGAHVMLRVTHAGGALEFDCAHGQILQPIRPDANGEFTVAGTFTPEHGGPVRKDNPPAGIPATYKGKINGNSMQLQIVLADKTQQPQQLQLTRGLSGKLVKCR